MNIRELKASEADKWNTFVKRCGKATFFHLAQWRDIHREVFGFENQYIYAERQGEILAILPLTLVRRMFFGNALISSPLCVYSGTVGDQEACIALEKEAVKRGKALGVEFVELRYRSTPQTSGIVRVENATFRNRLPKHNNEVLKSIPRKQRAEVRKAMTAGLVADWGRNIEPFYSIYATSVRNLGTPVFSVKYVRSLLRIFGDQCGILTVSNGNQPLASVLSFFFKNEVLPYYGGGVPEAKDFSAYPYMYWKLMTDAVDRGVEIFDFGRSAKGSGAYAFKKNFGFEPTDLPYVFHLLKARSLPDMNLNSARNRFLVSTWKRLPVSVANRLGPLLYPAVV